MAKKLPPISTRFQPGVSGNPAGGRLHNPAIRAIRHLTTDEIAEIGTLVLSKNITKLKQIAISASKDPNSKHSAFKSIMAMCMVKAFQKGDIRTLDALLDRIVGRVKEKVELTGPDGGPVRQLVGQMTPEERKSELTRLRKMRKDAGND